jgi:hypothetical protein
MDQKRKGLTGLASSYSSNVSKNKSNRGLGMGGFDDDE